MWTTGAVSGAAVSRYWRWHRHMFLCFSLSLSPYVLYLFLWRNICVVHPSPPRNRREVRGSGGGWPAGPAAPLRWNPNLYFLAFSSLTPFWLPFHWSKVLRATANNPKSKAFWKIKKEATFDDFSLFSFRLLLRCGWPIRSYVLLSVCVWLFVAGFV